MAIVNVSDQSFNAEIEGQGPVLVDFWAPWCGPCKMIAPILEELDAEVGDSVKIAKLNVDDNPETASRFGVMSIPTLILFKDGQPVDKIVGLNSKDTLKNLNINNPDDQARRLTPWMTPPVWAGGVFCVNLEWRKEEEAWTHRPMKR